MSRLSPPAEDFHQETKKTKRKERKELERKELVYFPYSRELLEPPAIVEEKETKVTLANYWRVLRADMLEA